MEQFSLLTYWRCFGISPNYTLYFFLTKLNCVNKQLILVKLSKNKESKSIDTVRRLLAPAAPQQSSTLVSVISLGWLSHFKVVVPCVQKFCLCFDPRWNFFSICLISCLRILFDTDLHSFRQNTTAGFIHHLTIFYHHVIRLDFIF